MTKNKDFNKYLWCTTVGFITYLLLGSFIVSRDFFDLAYLIILYVFLIADKVLNCKK